MKKGCLIALLGTVGFFVLLFVIGIIWAFVSPEAKEIARAQEQEAKLRAEAKEAETEKPAPAELGTKSLAKEELPSPKPEKKPESKTDSAELIEEARRLYSQLREMRHSASFHELGFGEGGPNHEWFKSFKTLQEKVNGNTELIVKGVVVGDLYTIGQEWMRNKGAETEVSKTLSAQLNKAFGIEETEKSKGTTIFEPRTWTSADGTQTFTGEYVGSGGGKVTIKKDGEPLIFSISLLSKEDQALIKKEEIQPGSIAAVIKSKKPPTTPAPQPPRVSPTPPKAPPISRRWRNPLGHVYSVSGTGNSHVLTTAFPDGSSLKEEDTVSSDGKKIVVRPKKVSPTGDYWIIDGQKNLLIMDDQGLIFTAKPF